MKRSTRAILLAAGLITTGGAAVLSWPPPKGSPKAILNMVKSGANETQMLDAVDEGSQSFDLSVDEIIRLKNANVPDSVIVEMLKKKSVLQKSAPTIASQNH